MRDKMILIIGAGFIGCEIAARISRKDSKLVSHTDDWKTIIENERPSLVVNTAGIVGEKKCGDAAWEDVKSANIDLPLQIAETALDHGSKCLLFSTGAVYAEPHSTPKPEQAERSKINNFYVQSKIQMEDAVRDIDVMVFRIPSVLGAGCHQWDYLNRIRRWQWVQNCYTSLLNTEALCEAVLNVERHKVSGVFNIANPGFVHLPTYVRQHYKKLPIWQDHQIPKDLAQTHILDITRAQISGIL